jgi:hypothetical protein
MASFCGFLPYFATTDLKLINFLPVLSAGHRHQKWPPSDFLKTEKGEFTNMKTLSVLFTFALLIAANQLARRLHSAHVSPINVHGNPSPVVLASSHFPQQQP